MEIDVAGKLLPAIAGVGVALFAFAVIMWVIKNRSSSAFSSRMFSMSGENSQRRISVVETAALDVRRRLILIRRDNVEHLIMVGGPADLVIESRDLNAAQNGRRQPSSEAPRPNPAPQAAYQPQTYEQPAYAQHERTQRAPTPAQQMRSRPSQDTYGDDDYAYGPEAAALGRQYEVDDYQSVGRREEEYRPNAAPAQPEISEQEDRAARLKRETAESILEAARQRLMGGQQQPARAQTAQSSTSQTPQRQSRAPTSAANSTRESAFSRVLDGRPQAGDIPASQTPKVRPERAWAPNPAPAPQRSTATGRTTAATARQETPEYSEEILEEKVRLILDELQRRS